MAAVSRNVFLAVLRYRTETIARFARAYILYTYIYNANITHVAVYQRATQDHNRRDNRGEILKLLAFTSLRVSKRGNNSANYRAHPTISRDTRQCLAYSTGAHPTIEFE